MGENCCVITRAMLYFICDSVMYCILSAIWCCMVRFAEMSHEECCTEGFVSYIVAGNVMHCAFGWCAVL